MEKSKYIFLFVILLTVTAVLLGRSFIISSPQLSTNTTDSVTSAPVSVDPDHALSNTQAAEKTDNENDEAPVPDAGSDAVSSSDKRKHDFQLKGSTLLLGENPNTSTEDRDRERFKYESDYSHLMQDGAYEEAVALAQKELEACKKDPQAGERLSRLYNDLARAYMSLGDVEAVQRIYAEWIEVAPDNVNPKIELAWIYTYFGNDYDTAVQLLNEVEQESPTADEYDKLTKFYAAADVVWEQERVLRDWLEKWPDDERAIYWWALLNRQEGNPAEALNAYKRLAEISPENPRILQELGNMHLKVGNAEEARRIYEQLLALQPDKVDLLLSLGDSYLDSGDLVRAQQHYESLVSIHMERGNSASPLLSLADRFERLGNTERALALYSLVMEQEAEDSPLAFLAWHKIAKIQAQVQEE